MDIIIIIAVIAILFFIAYKSKRITRASVVTITGRVKAGKTQLALWQAYKDYQERYFSWWIGYIFKKSKNLDKPVFYSNIQLGLPEYVNTCWLEPEHILRQVRLAPNCVVFIDEAALLARSSDWTDKEISDVLTDFVKLYAHETWGGSMYSDSQALADLHHSIKRCISTYYYIHHETKWVPGFVIMHVKEMMADPANADQSLDRISNGSRADVTTTLRWTLCPKKAWNWYDRYTYSALTDDLPIVANSQKPSKDLKTKRVLRVQIFKKGKKE